MKKYQRDGQIAIRLRPTPAALQTCAATAAIQLLLERIVGLFAN
jgi:hypothetical protein